MSSGTRLATVGAVVVAAALAPGVSASAAASRMPVYEVKSAGVSAAQAQRLAGALGLPSLPRRPDGSLLYVDDERFQRVPMKTLSGLPPGAVADEEGQPTVGQAFDFDALAQITAISPKDATARAEQAFRAAGLALPGPARTGHTKFRAFNADGRLRVAKNLDTGVGFAPRLNGLPLMGPGAKAGVEFDPEGNVTLVKQASRTLERGATVPLITGARADRIARARLSRGCPGADGLGGLRLKRRLVYYAPSLAHAHVKTIVPHYEYSGTANGPNGSRVKLVRFLLPAVQSAPRARLELTAKGSRIAIHLKIRGGRGPYAMHYSSCTTQLPGPPERGAITPYDYRPKPGLKAKREGGFVTVVDADGLVGVANASVAAPARGAAAPRRRNLFAFPASSGKDVGAEWLGNPVEIWNGEENAGDFLDEMEDEAKVRFNWNDAAVWPTDFQDEDKISGGDDKTWADNVDLLWYEGHGNPGLFLTGVPAPSLPEEYEYVDPNNIKWGNTGNDLEWIAFLGCDLLADTDPATGKGLDKRWVKAFKGVHEMFGYVSESYDFDSVGNEFGDEIADDEHKMRTAWATSALEQYVGVIYGAAGPIGSGDVNDYDDHFWGLGGSTGPDLKADLGYWYATGIVY